MQWIQKNFTLKVEAGGQYKVGAFISPQLREAGYLAPDSQVADIDATGSATVTLALNKLAEDNFISGRHAQVRARGNGQVVLEDLGSRNGTFIKLRGAQELFNGDYVFIGQQLFRVEMS